MRKEKDEGIPMRWSSHDAYIAAELKFDNRPFANLNRDLNYFTSG